MALAEARAKVRTRDPKHAPLRTRLRAAHVCARANAVTVWHHRIEEGFARVPVVQAGDLEVQVRRCRARPRRACLRLFRRGCSGPGPQIPAASLEPRGCSEVVAATGVARAAGSVAATRVAGWAAAARVTSARTPRVRTRQARSRSCAFDMNIYMSDPVPSSKKLTKLAHRSGAPKSTQTRPPRHTCPSAHSTSDGRVKPRVGGDEKPPPFFRPKKGTLFPLGLFAGFGGRRTIPSGKMHAL